jgi:hypothetical protein
MSRRIRECTEMGIALTARPRRALALGVVVTSWLFAVPPPASALAEPARAADSFVDSIGVNTHTTFSDTAYSQFGLVKQKLSELGVRHIRENLIAGRPDQYQALNELAASGIRADLIMEDPGLGKAGLDELLAILKTQVRGATDSVEGPNEWDIRGSPNWASDLRDYQQQLYAAIRSDPTLSSLPVVGPSVVRWEAYNELGDISSLLDYGNIHSYPDGYFPESNLASHLDYARELSSSKPVMATETGYHNALDWQGGHKPASEQAAAVYMPRVYLEYFRSGVARTYAYELVDEWPDPNHDSRESNFGLLRNDFSEKPAYVAIRNLIEILGDRGPSFQPGTLNYSLGGNLADLRQVLLQKRDGTFYLALWRTSSVWDPVNRVGLDSPAKSVTVTLEQPIGSAEQYVPNRSAAPAASYPSPSSPLNLMVGPEVVILRLVPGATGDGGGQAADAQPAQIKFWASKRSIRAGGRLGVGGRVAASGQSLRVGIQSWRGGWRTVRCSRTSRGGVFRENLRLPAGGPAQTERLRAVVPHMGRSRAIRVRVRR